MLVGDSVIDAILAKMPRCRVKFGGVDARRENERIENSKWMNVMETR